MRHIVFGLFLVTLGFLGIAYNWYQFLDLFWVLAPVLALLAGIVALLSGIATFREK